MGEASEQRVTTHFVLKWALAGLVLFVSIAGGIRAGFGSALRAAAAVSPLTLRNNSYLDVGDMFPDYLLRVPHTGVEGSVSQQVAKGPTVFLFLSQSCGSCDAMIEYWTKKVVPAVRSDIHLVAIYSQNEWAATGALDSSMTADRLHIVTADRDRQSELDGISSTPTIVGVDSRGRIAFIVSGFDRRVGSEFINEFL